MLMLSPKLLLIRAVIILARSRLVSQVSFSILIVSPEASISLRFTNLTQKLMQWRVPNGIQSHLQVLQRHRFLFLCFYVFCDSTFCHAVVQILFKQYLSLVLLMKESLLVILLILTPFCMTLRMPSSESSQSSLEMSKSISLSWLMSSRKLTLGRLSKMGPLSHLELPASALTSMMQNSSWTLTLSPMPSLRFK